MVEPFTGAAAELAIEKTGRAAFRKFRRLIAGDELKRLTRRLDRHFEKHPYLSAVDFGFIRKAPSVVSQIEALFNGERVDRDALADAIAPYVDVPTDAAPGADELAAQVAAAIERLAPGVYLEADERIEFRLDRLRADAGGNERERTVAYAVTLDWTPDDARRAVAKFVAEHPAEGASLDKELGTGADVGRVVRSLITNPPAWVEDGIPELWLVLGRLATSYGLWDEAGFAFGRALSQPIDNRAGVLAQAAESARAAGDISAYRSLLDQAIELDPQHVSVVVLQCQEVDDPAARLELLEHARVDTDVGRGALHATRALAFAAAGDFSSARDAAREATQGAPDAYYVLEAQATVELVAANRDGEQSRWKELEDAAATFRALKEKLRRQGRISEASRMLARAAEALMMAGNHRGAAELLGQEAAEPYVLNADIASRMHVADAAAAARRIDLLPKLMPEELGDDGVKLIRAQMDLAGGRVAPAVASLDALVKRSSDANIRKQAALIRLSEALDDPAVAWSLRAEQELAEHQNLVVVLKALHLANEKDFQAAENLLLPLSGHRERELLVDLALERGDTELAVERMEALVDAAPTPRRHLRLAHLLHDSGKADAARSTLAPLLSDESLPEHVRADAYLLATQEAYDSHRFDDAARLADSWAEFDDDPQILWIRLDSLTALGEYEAARELFDSASPNVRRPSEARIAAQLLFRAYPRAEALARIVSLSDQFNREDERLEGLVIATYQRPGGDLDPDLEARVGETISTFGDRFPDSLAGARAVNIEEFEALVREQHLLTKTALSELADAITAGRAPVAFIGATLGESASEAWGRVRLLPLAFPDAALKELEVGDAARAIGREVVLDSSALHVLGGLPVKLRELIRGVLKDGRIPAAVLQDADFGARDANPEDEAAEQTRVLWDEVAGRPVLVHVDAEIVREDQRRAGAVLDLARSFRHTPNTDAERPSRFDKDVQESLRNIRDVVGATIPATLAIADRLSIPVYSDDRVIRLASRQEGLAAFGTLALIDALAGRGLITADDRSEARALLRASVCAGVGFESTDEMNAALARSGYTLNEEMRGFLRDPSNWAHEGESYAQFVRLLAQVRANADPSTFRRWVALVCAASAAARPHEFSHFAGIWLMIIALLEQPREFVHELHRALKETTGHDPLKRAMFEIMRFRRTLDRTIAPQLTMMVLGKLEPADQLEMLGVTTPPPNWKFIIG